MLLAADRPGTGRITFVVRPVRENPQRAFLNAMNRSATVLERGGRRIGYIHLWCMTNDVFKDALNQALAGKLADTDGLVLDLRDGFGGRPFGFSDLLFRPDVIWEQRDRNGGSRQHSGYSRPMVALINGGTRSAKEFLSYQLKKSRRASLGGTRTAGAFLAAGGVPIGLDGFLEVPVSGLKLDGITIEGAGVEPDIAVEGEDAYAPSDAQLRRGIDVLLERIGSAGQGSNRSKRAAVLDLRTKVPYTQ